MKYHILFFLYFILISISVWSQTIDGRVVNAATMEPIPFVNIGIIGTNLGTGSDMDGLFRLNRSEAQGRVLRFSSIGFKEASVHFNDSLLGIAPGHLTIALEPDILELREVSVTAGENPALRIMKLVLDNRDKNNPEKYSQFKYRSYNKLVASLSDADIAAYERRLLSMDSMPEEDAEALHFLKNNYLFLMESVTERKFMAPDRSREHVLASKTSGLKEPWFAVLATDIQPFSFYKDYLQLGDKTYLSPLSKGSTSRYDFFLEEILPSGTDTIFVIFYQPKKGKNAEMLRGVLNIHSHQYGVMNLTAKPAEEGKIDLELQQQYQLLENSHWFPQQLNATLRMNQFQSSSGQMSFTPLIVSRSYLKDVDMNPGLKPRDFTELAVDFDQEAFKRGEGFWGQERSESFGEREITTYRTIDSIGELINLDKKMKVFTSIATGRLPVFRYMDIQLNHLLGFNQYESLRPGLGLATSRNVSKYWSIGGYGAYGFRDMAWKYGGNLSIFPGKSEETIIQFGYWNDLREVGHLRFLKTAGGEFNNRESIRKFLISNFDKTEEYNAFLQLRAMRYLLVRAGIQQRDHEVTSDYRFLHSWAETTLPLSRYRFSEASLSLRFGFREKFILLSGRKVSLGTKYPIIFVNYVQGFREMDGLFEYHRADVAIEKSFLIRNLGKTRLYAECGNIWGTVPYSVMYNHTGSNFFESVTVYAQRTFQTMGLTEFYSNRFASLFFSHDFGKLLLRTKRFSPGFVVVHNMGIGQLDRPGVHLNFPITSIEKGFAESGLVINDLLSVLSAKNNSFSTIGMGIFYRYGHYRFQEDRDNLVFTISSSLSF